MTRFFLIFSFVVVNFLNTSCKTTGNDTHLKAVTVCEIDPLKVRKIDAKKLKDIEFDREPFSVDRAKSKLSVPAKKCAGNNYLWVALRIKETDDYVKQGEVSPLALFVPVLFLVPSADEHVKGRTKVLYMFVPDTDENKLALKDAAKSEHIFDASFDRSILAEHKGDDSTTTDYYGLTELTYYLGSKKAYTHKFFKDN